MAQEALFAPAITGLQDKTNIKSAATSIDMQLGANKCRREVQLVYRIDLKNSA
jgi:hypothetical protein